MTKILLISLSADARGAREALQSASRTSPVEVLQLRDVPSAARRLLRQRHLQLAIAGAPPGDEVGYGLTPVVALASRPSEILMIDLRSGSVRPRTLTRYLAAALPFGCVQLLLSAVAVVAQRAITHLAASPGSVEGPIRELSNLLYLRPSVGAPSSIGGSVTHSHEVIRALKGDGVEVEAVTTDTSIAETTLRDPDPPCRWRVANVLRVFKALPASAGFGSDIALVRAALGTARATDLIYQRHARFSLAGALLARATGKPLFLEYNGSEEFVGRYWSPTPLKRQLAACERAALRGAARIFVVSEADRQDLIARGIDSRRIIVNPNGVAVERFARGGGAGVRQRLGLAENDFAIGFVGTFGPWHGAPVLARAFSSIAAEMPRARLVLVGDGPELEATRQQLVADGVANRAISVGKVTPSEVPEYLDACDVLASPHVHLPDGVEFFGSPTKLFEYMASGKAIVASELGQIADVLEHGRTAWLVPPGDEDALAAALRELATVPQLREELGAGARRQAAHHTWRKNAGRIIDAYRALGGGAP